MADREEGQRPGHGRMKEERAAITKAADGGLDAEVDAMLDEVKFRSDHRSILKREDKQAILRGLALRDSTRQIRADVNRLREARGDKLLEDSQLQFTAYKRTYGEAIERIYNRYAVDIHRIYPFSDKFVRIKSLDTLARRFSEYIGETVKLNSETRTNVALFLRVLRALHEEMGITKYVVTRDVSEDKGRDILDGVKNPEKMIERVLLQRYGKQLGIESEPVEEAEEVSDENEE